MKINEARKRFYEIIDAISLKAAARIAIAEHSVFWDFDESDFVIDPHNDYPPSNLICVYAGDVTGVSKTIHD